MVERNKKIADHLELDEIKSVMKEYKDSYDMYRKLLVISMVYQGETISNASDYVHTSRKTGERWVKNYNEKGLEGLKSRTGKKTGGNKGQGKRKLKTEEERLQLKIKKLEIENARLKKGYQLKGVGGKKEYVTIFDVNTK